MKNKEIKKIKFLFLLFGTLLLLLLFKNYEVQQHISNFFEKNRAADINLKKEHTIASKGVKDAAYYSDGILIYRENELVKYNNSGSELWKKDIVLKNYGVLFGKINTYLYEKNSGYIQCLNQDGEIIKEVNLDSKIQGIKLDFEIVMVHTRDRDGKEKVCIIDREGNVKYFNQDYSDILTYTISKDKGIYSVSELLVEKDKINCLVSTYKNDGELLYEKDFKDEMVLFSQFIDSHRLVVMTNKKLYLLNDFEGNTLWEKPYDMIKSIDIKNNKISILFGNSLEIISANGSIDEKYSFTEEYDQVLCLDDLVVGNGEEYVIGLKDGKAEFKKSFKNKIKKLVKGKDKIIIIFDDKIESYKLVE